MGIQVVLHHTDQNGVRKMHIDQVFHALRIVLCRAPFGHFDMAPARERLKEQEQVTTAFALVFIIVASRLALLKRQWRAYLTNQLIGRFVKADHRILGIVLLGIQIKHIFHAPDKLGTDARNAPFFLAPRLHIVFLSVRRTVSSEIAWTSLSSMSLSASNCIVHCLRSSGGVLQAQATSVASALPSSLGVPPGRERSVRAASTPPSTKRLRMRSTVAVPMWSA